MGYVVSLALASTPGELANKIRQRFINIILKGRGVPNPRMTHAVSPLLEVVDQATFDSEIKGELESALNLRAETKLEAITTLFNAATKVDLSSYAENPFFMDSLSKTLTNSTSDEVRDNAIAFTQAIGRRCRTAAIALSVLQSLGSVLDGSSSLGKQVVAQSFQRASVVSAIDIFTSCMEKKNIGGCGDTQDAPSFIENDREAIAELAIDILSEFAKSEGNAGVRGQALVSIVHWVDVGNLNELNPLVVDSLLEGVLLQPSFAKEYIRALSLLCSVTCSPSLTKQVAKAACAKSALARKFETCIVGSVSGNTAASSASVPGVGSKTKSTTKKVDSKKKKKGGNLDSLEAEMLALGGGGKSKKSGTSKKKTTTVASSASKSSTSTSAGNAGVIGALYDTLVQGEEISSNIALFRQNYTSMDACASVLLLLSNADEGFKSKVNALENGGLSTWGLADSSKKIWSSLLVKSSRMANGNELRSKMYIAGVEDDSDEKVSNQNGMNVPWYKLSSRWDRNVLGLDEDQEAQLSLCRLVQNLVEKCLMNMKDKDVICASLVALSLSPYYIVRSNALRTLKTFCQSSDTAADDTLKWLQVYLLKASPKIYSAIVGTSLANLLETILLQNPSTDILPKAIILGHHPALQNARFWSKIVKRIYKGICDPTTSVIENADTQRLVVDELFLNGGKDENMDEATRRAIATLASSVSDFSKVPGLIPAISAALDKDAINSVTPRECDILTYPMGTLSDAGMRELEEQVSEKKSGKKANAAIGAGGGRSGGMYSSKDDEWERQVRAELEAKKLLEQQAKQGSAVVQKTTVDEKIVIKKTEEEDAIRTRVEPIHRNALSSIRLIETLCTFAKSTTHKSMRELNGMCFPLVSAPLLSSHVGLLFEQLIATSPNKTLQESKMVLSAALRIALVEDFRIDALLVLGQACRILHVNVCGLEAESHSPQQLSLGSVLLLFPILKEMISGATRDPVMLFRWAAQMGRKKADDEEEEDDDDEEAGGEEDKKKKKDKKTKDKTSDKTKKKKKKKEAEVAEPSPATPPPPPVNGGPLEGTPADNDDDGDDGDVESPSESIERALALLQLHASILAKDTHQRSESVSAVLAACDVLPLATPRPGVVLKALCACPPALVGQDVFSLLLGDRGLLSESGAVRKAVLLALRAAATVGLPVKADRQLVSTIWFAASDEDEENADAAEALIEFTKISLPVDFIARYVKILSHPYSHARLQAGRAIQAGVAEHPDTGEEALAALTKLYHDELRAAKLEEKNKVNEKAKFHDRDAEKKEAARRERLCRPRAGVAHALLACADIDGEGGVFDKKQATEAFGFICKDGLRDENSMVRQVFLDAGTQLVKSYGKHMIDEMLPMLEPYLSMTGGDGNVTEKDWQREGAVIFVGTLASFLSKDDERIPRIVDNLLEALRTPNEAVQMAATKCLPPLMKATLVKQRGPQILDQLLTRATLLEMVAGDDDDDEFVQCPSSVSTSYGERRGAAFGVGSVVKGLGITVLKKNKVVARLETGCKSDRVESRQGSLFVLESLCTSLGMLFEPYIIGILPALLQCFADSKKVVRVAASDASRAIMARLSGHGVKLIMPSLLKAIEDPAWRTKQAAIRMLGSMAFCARKQLAACLPQIVPVLVHSFTDTHTKVRTAGSKALKEIGSVIQNPEIQALVPTLKKALMNPHEKTGRCVDILHRTRFVHMVDAPSLALIVPVLDRGLNERSTDTKKKAALIVGNMCSMISDPKAVLPYVKDLMPVLQKVLVDPIPGVRSTAAKALGTLTDGLGEGLPNFTELLQWLLETSRVSTSPVERSGGAQGLVEVICALGEEYTNMVLDENIFCVANDASSFVREGVVWVLVFLPPCLGAEDNSPLIDRELPIIIKGLSDESELVRDVSLRAGQVLVEQHAILHTDKLLPVLEKGLTDSKWRIRQSSVHLLGDLLYRIGGSADAVAAVQAQARLQFANADDEDDAEELGSEDEGSNKKHDIHIDGEDGVMGKAFIDEKFEATIAKALGKEKRHDILASLYLMRSDPSAVVRQSSLSVWKNIVPNTGRALREILKSLMKKIVEGLSSDSEDKRLMAGRCLGDIVKKLGDRVLPDIVPIIQEGLLADNEEERAGISLGLIEIIRAASKVQLENYLSQLLPSVERALCDTCPEVQDAAADAFAALYRQVGGRAVMEIVPNLLTNLEKCSKMEDELEGERALAGLCKILSLRSREIMPLLLPKLLVSPMTVFHANALGAACATISHALHYYVEKILDFLIEELATRGGGPGGENEQELSYVWNAVHQLVESIEEDGLSWFIPPLLSTVSEGKGQRRRVAVSIIGEFCGCTETEFDEYIPGIIKETTRRFSVDDKTLLQQSWNTFRALTKATEVETLSSRLDFTRSMLKSVASDARYRLRDATEREAYVLPGLCLTKGLEPFLPMYQHALMNASPPQRESAALGLGELVDLTSPQALRPFVIKITGPLIRIVGDRFPWEVKVAILKTLGKLLEKGGPMLRPFLPQLQTTFVKSLNSETTMVRTEGSRALKKLMKIGTRVDPLVNDLGGTASSDDTDSGVRLSVLEALAGVLEVSGKKVSQPVLEKCIQNCNKDSLLFHRDASIRENTVLAIATAASFLEEEAQAHTIREFFIDRVKELSGAKPSGQDWVSAHVALLLIAGSARHSTALIYCEQDRIAMYKKVILSCGEEGRKQELVQVREGVALAAGAMLGGCPAEKKILAKELAELLVQCSKDKNTNIRAAALRGLMETGKRNPDGIAELRQLIVPAAFACVKDTKSVVSQAADQALVSILELRTRPETLNEFTKQCKTPSLARSVAEYCRKTLVNVEI
uniref:TOG domain-containing protein n=1 Tax=Mucochytrium quahogii TaxID=96639 RepID=A0A7S2RDU6_9STRA